MPELSQGARVGLPHPFPTLLIHSFNLFLIFPKALGEHDLLPTGNLPNPFSPDLRGSTIQGQPFLEHIDQPAGISSVWVGGEERVSSHCGVLASDQPA